MVVHTLKQEDLSQFEASLVYQSVPVSKTKQTATKTKKPQICSFIPFVRQGLTLIILAVLEPQVIFEFSLSLLSVGWQV